MMAPNPGIDRTRDPHAGQSVATAGRRPEDAGATLILLHGRGGSADEMLGLWSELGVERVAGIALQAASNTWYPNSFLAPLESNQPYLDSALRRVESTVADLIARGVGSERIALLGFSQGACLASEFVARHPRRYGAVMVLTGGLIGPEGSARDYSGSLAGTPVFLGTNDPDPHVPFARVEETEAVLGRMGAKVELRRYPGMPHSVNEDEIEACLALIGAMTHSKGSRSA